MIRTLMMMVVAGALTLGIAGCKKEEPKPMTPSTPTSDMNKAKSDATTAADKAGDAAAAAADAAKKEADKAASDASK